MYPDKYGENQGSCPEFSDLLGKTLVSVEVFRDAQDDHIDFALDTGETYRMYHSQDCCEDVSITDISGVPAHLVGEVKLADEAVSGDSGSDNYDSNTWTFYRISTDSEHVDIRWHGSSNGYYSEGVDWALLVDDNG